ncbi:MAG: exodeoxyribonuclease VII small subunit [Coriobacteriia bacterium]|nr:exodeoxyribonuclease VII small subunit [Coriobacteriia bacterium]
MSNAAVPSGSYEQLKERLDQIVDAVSVDDLSLDEALDLYEEAVKLGMRASELIEQDTRPQSEEPADESANS